MQTQEQDRYWAEGDEALRATREPLFVRWHDGDYGHRLAVVVAGEVDDPLGESNYAAAVGILGGFGDDVEETTVGRSGRTWLRCIAVRPFDEHGRVTEAWRVAVDEIIVPLRDYPLLDEDDYYAREHEVLLARWDLDYGDAAGIVSEALDYFHPAPSEADHDDVVAAVEAWLATAGDEEPRLLEVQRVRDLVARWHDENPGVDLAGVLDGLGHYVRQRRDGGECPGLVALLGL